MCSPHLRTVASSYLWKWTSDFSPVAYSTNPVLCYIIITANQSVGMNIVCRRSVDHWFPWQHSSSSSRMALLADKKLLHSDDDQWRRQELKFGGCSPLLPFLRFLLSLSFPSPPPCPVPSLQFPLSPPLPSSAPPLTLPSILPCS